MGREIKNECLGGGRMALSLADVDRGWVRCGLCSRPLSIRPAQ
jgi:hypothetical protein